MRRTLPRVRELKHKLNQGPRKRYVSRTLPRVRELKRKTYSLEYLIQSRTLPRVRELKHIPHGSHLPYGSVAPFPGCVN